MDDLDRRLVAALQVNGRATWSSIAAALGVSERTVTRRLGPLLAGGTVRVAAIRNPVLDPGVTGLALRIRCRPGRTPQVAEALSALPEVWQVLILEGGDEIAATVWVSSPERLKLLLLKELPRLGAIDSWQTRRLLWIYPHSLGWRAPLLTPEERVRLGETTALPATRPRPVPDEVDQRLIALLRADGRLGYTELARQSNVSESTARRKVEALLREGAIVISTTAEPRLLGFHLEALLWLTIQPAGLGRVAEVLAAHPATAMAATTSGPSNLLVSVVCRDGEDLYDLITGTLGALPEVTGVDVTPVLHVARRAGVSHSA
ncbi:Lrp/AsnC family transcriptional regulator [Crossiella sp. CA-258035]|uniref:Lrp/AsnC family transcriptional regulator n=1 Tax=Crossiella sp. CA-258035 TaxID=2981138 RepID=UPI0024BC6EF5|nr:Lrp/AsnC family transcriptional regulator [Crossiella sp. CA-258035]WHT15899.1 Lrp/AsnC family transcriptional regulator [Crossiella sp. CA-258035]